MFPLHIDIYGKSGAPLVLLHGWGWHSGIWFPLLPNLVEHYRVYLVDLPGFGQTTAIPSPYSFENIVPSILKAVPAKAAWLGWSMGGLFATWIAAKFPERVTQLITIASTPKFIQDEKWPGIETSTLEKFSNLLILDYKKTLHDFLELQLRGSANRNQLSQTLQKVIQAHPPSQEGLQKGLALLKNSDLRSEINKISCPNLHIFGQLDTIVPIHVIDSLSLLYTQGEYEVINRTGHMPFLSHPEIIINLLHTFLREHPMA